MNDPQEILKFHKRLFRLSLLIGVFLTTVVLIHKKIWVVDLSGKTEILVIQEHPDLIDSLLIGQIDEESGLIMDHGINIVKAQCGSCHSTKLVAQNGFNREGWIELIRWMQKEQNLWDLGEAEGPILDYLEKNCAPKNFGRRKQLHVTDWYVLNE